MQRVTVALDHSQSHLYTHTRQDFPGRGIGPSQGHLPAQHTTFTRDKHPCPHAGFEPTIPGSERPQTYFISKKVGKCEMYTSFHTFMKWVNFRFFFLQGTHKYFYKYESTHNSVLERCDFFILSLESVSKPPICRITDKFKNVSEFLYYVSFFFQK